MRILSTQVLLPVRGDATSMVLSPDGKWLLVGTTNVVRVLSVNPMTGAVALSAATIASSEPTSLAFGADGAHAVIATQGDDMLRIYAFNTSTGAVGARATREFAMPADPSQIAVGDFNGDGLNDYAVTATGDYNVAILLGDKDGPVSSVSSVSGCYDSRTIIAEDFDHDGITDLLKVCTMQGVLVYLGHGDGTFAAGVPL
jgi:WD40 repeat protein